jgi:hypothetical protein
LDKDTIVPWFEGYSEGFAQLHGSFAKKVEIFSAIEALLKSDPLSLRGEIEHCKDLVAFILADKTEHLERSAIGNIDHSRSPSSVPECGISFFKGEETFVEFPVGVGSPLDGISLEEFESLEVGCFLAIVNEGHPFAKHGEDHAVFRPSPNCSNSVPSQAFLS